MDTRARIRTRGNRGEAAVWEYLDTSCVDAAFRQDPAARGLGAVLTYGQDQWNAGWDVLRTSPAFPSEAETAMTTLFGDVLHYWARRNPKAFDLLQRRIWELRAEFEKFDFDRFVDEEELAALSVTDVSEVIARLLADLLLCAERLNLSSDNVFANGVRFFVSDWNQLKFEQLPPEEQQAYVTLATLADQKLILGFRPHGHEGDGMWHVQENPLDHTMLPTGDVAAYAEGRHELLRRRPEKPGSAWGSSAPR
ncbi:hypothetical protein ACFY5F_36285 [Streptomyces sp. NPDC013161]|uniref:hypothetical protein n=1 Tax=Streptomyces sp. NPDC013161 TaxID=3364862 RepID=UPI0036955D6A